MSTILVIAALFVAAATPQAASPFRASGDPETAKADGDGDYAARVLGETLVLRGPRVAGPDSAGPTPAPRTLDTGSRSGGVKLFVFFEIDPREAGSLHDAVAGLGAAADFAADGRFPPTAEPGGIERIAGWILIARLGDALRRPGVKSVQVDPVRPPPAADVFSNFRVGVRVTDAEHAPAQVAAAVRDMAAAAGFRATRVDGMETAPDGSATALVEGRLALAQLGSLLNRAEVLRVDPLLPGPTAAPPRAPAPDGAAGFARFVFRHGKWLLLLTLLAALPSLRFAASRVGKMFSPDRGL